MMKKFFCSQKHKVNKSKEVATQELKSLLSLKRTWLTESNYMDIWSARIDLLTEIQPDRIKKMVDSMRDKQLCFARQLNFLIETEIERLRIELNDEDFNVNDGP